MITADDLEYHHPPDADYTWAETYYLPISLPDEHVFIHVYVVIRPVLGVMANYVRVHGDVSASEWEVLYDDSQQHLPAPERFSQINAPTGLQVFANEPPRNYRIDYVGYDETEIHVDWTGIMDPFDLHDPRMNPLAAETKDERVEATSMGSGYKGHFDMHGRVTGTVSIRGRTFEVDSIDRMDRSWGPRPELEIPPMNSVWASFGESLGIRFHGSLDLDAPTGQDQKLAHGYVLDDGDVYALADLDVTTRRLGIVPVSMEFLATDVRGKEFHLRGVADAGAPAHLYAATVTWFGLYRWERDGRYGNGSVQENHPLRAETRRRGRWWTDRTAYLNA